MRLNKFHKMYMECLALLYDDRVQTRVQVGLKYKPYLGKGSSYQMWTLKLQISLPRILCRILAHQCN